MPRHDMTTALPVLAIGLLAAGLGACSSSSAAKSTPASSPAPAATSTPTVSSASEGLPNSATISPTGPTSSVSDSPSAGGSPSTAGTGTGVQAWLGYHSDQGRTGAVVDEPGLQPATHAWTASLGAAVRGQPVVADGRIIAATEKNRVVALRPADGAVLWSRTLGTPLTDVDTVAGCGNIDPLGITSTAVIDARTGTVYVVAEISDGGARVHHQLFGLDIATGAVRLNRLVDPPLPGGEKAVQLLQRTSLALGNGRVYVSFGGNSGDCGAYHGWVVGVNETGSAPETSFEVASDGQGGAIWQSGGAPAIDDAGNIYVTTGNANPDPPQGGPDPKKYTESIVELSPDLKPLAAFKDMIAGGDEDLSTSNPVLIGDQVFASGKTDVGYFVSRDGLHQIAAVKNLCGSDPDGGPAYDARSGRLFVPCKAGGIQVIDVTRHALGPLLKGADSAPIIVGTHVWSVAHTTGTLYSYDAATGAVQQKIKIAPEVPIFTSPTAALGLLLVGTDDGVVGLR